MQSYFAEIRDFSWLFDEKISNSQWKRIFNEKSRQFAEPIVHYYANFQMTIRLERKVTSNFRAEKRSVR